VDDVTGGGYLADTGSVYSLLPHSAATPPTGPKLVTADGLPVACWGTCAPVDCERQNFDVPVFARSCLLPDCGGGLFEESPAHGGCGCYAACSQDGTLEHPAPCAAR